MFAQALQVAPVYALTGNIILCYNLLFLSTFVISAIGGYLLVRDLTGDWRAGVIAGLVYGFLPYRISQVPHLQIMSSQWMPLALWACIGSSRGGPRAGWPAAPPLSCCRTCRAATTCSISRRSFRCSRCTSCGWRSGCATRAPGSDLPSPAW